MNKRTDGKMAQRHTEEKTTGTLGRDEEVGNGMIQYNDVTCESWHLKWPAWLSVQQFFQVNNKNHQSSAHYWPYVDKIHQRIHLTKASNAESISMSWYHHVWLSYANSCRYIPFMIQQQKYGWFLVWYDVIGVMDLTQHWFRLWL